MGLAADLSVVRTTGEPSVSNIARGWAFGIAAVVTEIVGWVMLLGQHQGLGVVLILAGPILWGGVPGVADTKPSSPRLMLGLGELRGRVQGWDSAKGQDKSKR